MIRVLFVGESWLGSCARSLKEALATLPEICLDEVNEDLFMPKHSARWMRAINRLLWPAYRDELYRQILYRTEAFKPDIVMVYKGFSISASFVCQLQATGCKVVNVYPDCSPHAHGVTHKKALGAYDLVISTKPFHPVLWQRVYGYGNRCEFVPQGYDPAFHLVPAPPSCHRFDLTLVATWRHEYGKLMKDLGQLLVGKGISVGIGGNGWLAHREDFPSDWVFAGALQGRSYVDWLRQGKICLAPLTRKVIINGAPQPGDEDTTRTYELAAAHCFFLHQRTDFVATVYDEQSEVPMWGDARELASLVQRWLPDEEGRRLMAARAHARAVPSYSIPQRAASVLQHIVKLSKARAVLTVDT